MGDTLTYGVGGGARTDAAMYGRTPGGAAAARDQWHEGMGNNDLDQADISRGATYADRQAQEAQRRGATAYEDPRLARNEASGAGGHQQGVVGLAGTLARGNQPSVAAMQLQQGLNQTTGMQQAIARGARGAAGVATAGANSQANIANAQQNAWTQGGALRAKEMAMGRGLLGSALGQQREQDNARLGQGNAMAQFNAQENDKFALDMGNAAVGLGDVGNMQNQMDQQYWHAGMQPIDAQSEAAQQAQRWEADRRKQEVAAIQEDG